jgi:hypothetical protein
MGNRTYTGNVLPYVGSPTSYVGASAESFVGNIYTGSSGGNPGYYGVGENPSPTGLGLIFTIMMDTHAMTGYTGGYVLTGLNETAYQIYGRAGYMTSNDGPGTRDLLNPTAFTGPAAYQKLIGNAFRQDYIPGPVGNNTLTRTYIRDQGNPGYGTGAHKQEVLNFSYYYTGLPRVLVSDMYIGAGLVQVNVYDGVSSLYVGPSYVPNYTRNYTEPDNQVFNSTYQGNYTSNFLRTDSSGYARNFVRYKSIISAVL